MGVVHPKRRLSLRTSHRLGIVVCCCAMIGLSGPAESAFADDTVRPIRMILKLDRSVSGADSFAAHPIRSAGLDAIRPMVHSVRPLVPNPADPELAATTGLDQFFVVTLKPGFGADEVLALAGDGGSGSSIRPEMGAQIVRQALDVHDFEPPPERVIVDPSDLPGVQPVNDPFFPEQWALRNTGQEVEGVTGVQDADIDAPPSWALASNALPVVVAVLDTGVSPTHPDLANVLVPGFNAADGNADDTSDLIFSHGTGCAGVIAAEHDNLFGIAGVAANALVMPIRIFNSTGFGYELEFVAGLTFAADNGAQVASMSIGFPFYSEAMAAAVEYAHGRDVVLVASTGNVNGQAVQFPALMSETISVGATDNRDLLWQNSTGGPEITLVAPGVDVLSAWDTVAQRHTFKRQTGTSFAAPQVAGIAALVRGVAPHLSNDEITWALINSCDIMGSSAWDPSHGYGRINAANAVALALSVGDGECRIDFDGDGRFSIDDIEAYIEAFLAGDPLADLVAPFGAIDQDDLGSFINMVLSGCSDDGTP